MTLFDCSGGRRLYPQANCSTPYCGLSCNPASLAEHLALRFNNYHYSISTFLIQVLQPNSYIVFSQGRYYQSHIVLKMLSNFISGPAPGNRMRSTASVHALQCASEPRQLPYMVVGNTNHVTRGIRKEVEDGNGAIHTGQISSSSRHYSEKGRPTPLRSSPVRSDTVCTTPGIVGGSRASRELTIVT